MSAGTDVCVSKACNDRTADNAQFAGAEYCTAACACGLGGGDCDPEDVTGCLPGLVCANNYGPAFGMPPGHEVCVPKTCTERTAEDAQYGKNEFCTAACPCGLGGGDCDPEDVTGCLPGLVCANNYGPAFGLPPGHEVCVPHTCTERTADDAQFGKGEFCTAACPCGLGGGDCDPEDVTGCMPGLECRNNVGKAFGLDPTYEVCVPIGCQTGTMYTANYCTSACPCGVGGGNCASDAACMPGLKCGTNNRCYKP
jgi:hypothetical protein